MVNFYIYDITFLVLFTAFVIWFLYTRRRNLKREGPLYLYRTKFGIKAIDYIAKKYKKSLNVLQYVSIICGFILMIAIIALFFQITYIYVSSPEVVRSVKVPPVIPLIPYLPEIFKLDFLPPFYFTYWILILAVIAITHEFAHGIFAKFHNVKVKSTGFGFLGPFLAAFVEPDEKQMQKKPKYQQIAVLSAGTFTNLILAILFFFMLSGFFVLTYAPSGALFNSYALGIVNINSIDKINGFSISDNTNQGILDIINKNKVIDDVNLAGNNYTKIIADNKTYFIRVEGLKNQLKQEDKIIVYFDSPAIEAGLSGTIIAINKEKISSQADLASIMKKYSPGNKIKITTKDNNKIRDYEIKLGEDPNNKSRAVIGIIYISPQKGTVLGKIYDFFNFSKEKATDYEPRYNTDFIVFIYNLIWWLALINLSVALMNMLPFTIFDGGRFFMLTVWGITKSQKFAEWAFRMINWVILGIIFIMMVGWAVAVF